MSTFRRVFTPKAFLIGEQEKVEIEKGVGEKEKQDTEGKRR